MSKVISTGQTLNRDDGHDAKAKRHASPRKSWNLKESSEPLRAPEPNGDDTPETTMKPHAGRRLADDVPDAELYAAARYPKYLRDQGGVLARTDERARGRRTDRRGSAIGNKDAMEDVSAGRVHTLGEVKEEKRCQKL